ncbi:MAG TPA: ABC transporter permease [Acidimicrobiales bacterium]|jgi:phospholipid/cholesterol/gamma-HCH transport system permease protein|nr:ABC transporter permease [Acidimicrobiales bacterium]
MGERQVQGPVSGPGGATVGPLRPDPAAVLPRRPIVPARPDGKVAAGLRETGRMFAIAFEAVRQLFVRGLPVSEFFDQCWFLARVTTLPLILVSIPFGMVIALEVGSLLQQIGAQSQLGAAMVLAVVREQAPVATALLIAGAGGSAMCADLGSRRIRTEISAMEVMGVNPIHRLVLPRLLAATVVAFLLDAVVSVAGILGGLYFGVVSVHVTQSSFFATFSELAQLADLGIALFKAAVFGFLAAMVACYKGLYAKGGPKGVGDAVNQAVVVTFILAFFVNFVLTVFYFNFVPQKAI